MTDTPLREAWPSNMMVGRRGSPLPPDSQYFVLDLVYDHEARVVVARLGRRYDDAGQQIKAEQCWQALDESQDAHQAYCERRYPKKGRGRAKS